MMKLSLTDINFVLRLKNKSKRIHDVMRKAERHIDMRKRTWDSDLGKVENIRKVDTGFASIGHSRNHQQTDCFMVVVLTDTEKLDRRRDDRQANNE